MKNLILAALVMSPLAGKSFAGQAEADATTSVAYVSLASSLPAGAQASIGRQWVPAFTQFVGLQGSANPAFAESTSLSRFVQPQTLQSLTRRPWPLARLAEALVEQGLTPESFAALDPVKQKRVVLKAARVAEQQASAAAKTAAGRLEQSLEQVEGGEEGGVRLRHVREELRTWMEIDGPYLDKPSGQQLEALSMKAEALAHARQATTEKFWRELPQRVADGGFDGKLFRRVSDQDGSRVVIADRSPFAQRTSLREAVAARLQEVGNMRPSPVKIGMMMSLYRRAGKYIPGDARAKAAVLRTMQHELVDELTPLSPGTESFKEYAASGHRRIPSLRYIKAIAAYYDSLFDTLPREKGAGGPPATASIWQTAAFLRKGDGSIGLPSYPELQVAANAVANRMNKWAIDTSLFLSVLFLSALALTLTLLGSLSGPAIGAIVACTLSIAGVVYTLGALARESRRLNRDLASSRAACAISDLEFRLGMPNSSAFGYDKTPDHIQYLKIPGVTAIETAPVTRELSGAPVDVKTTRTTVYFSSQDALDAARASGQFAGIPGGFGYYSGPEVIGQVEAKGIRVKLIQPGS